ncbi:MAG: hypothetical protein A2104_03715 [Candidatus Melainabacteria bacterium GWF2_32_7]|nr:MAG: hypothetical protein A2104_03715 [Candidatus Melainabacteria bacterium GWF2_32_7]
MFIDVIFSPYELASRGNISEKSVIVVDVLRATSTIAYALWGYRVNGMEEIQGCSKIIPVETIEEAKKIAEKFPGEEILLAGERHCIKPEDFDLGNSPSEYTQDKVQGKTIIFTTTNGTMALKLSQSAKFITTGAFVNTTACVDRVFQEKNDVLILCAGRSNKTTKEDTACAGLIAKQLIKRCEENDQEYELSDAADIAIKFFDHYKSNIQELFRTSEAGKNLIEVNLDKDLRDCSLIDLLSITTEFKNGYITGKIL